MIKSIKYENFEVLDSGSLITIGPIGTTFELVYNNETLFIIIDFLTDPENNKARFQFTVGEENTTGRLSLFNFNNDLGFCSTSPISLGDIGGRELLILFHASSLSHSECKKINYTFYLGKEI